MFSTLTGKEKYNELLMDNSPRHSIVRVWILTKYCGFQFIVVIRIEQVYNCNYLAITVVIHENYCYTKKSFHL